MTAQKHKRPADDSPSPFVMACLAHKSLTASGLALDLACGYGRHTRKLGSMGFSAVSGDLSMDCLGVTRRGPAPAFCVCLDARAELPFTDSSFRLVLIVHYVDKGLLARAARVIAPGGFLIYESYGGQGENWRSLPAHGEVENELSGEFSVIRKCTRPVGPKDGPRENVKLFARKNSPQTAVNALLGRAGDGMPLSRSYAGPHKIILPGKG